jgi:hypothetical protein
LSMKMSITNQNGCRGQGKKMFVPSAVPRGTAAQNVQSA